MHKNSRGEGERDGLDVKNYDCCMQCRCTALRCCVWSHGSERGRTPLAGCVCRWCLFMGVESISLKRRIFLAHRVLGVCYTLSFFSNEDEASRYIRVHEHYIL